MEERGRSIGRWSVTWWSVDDNVSFVKIYAYIVIWLPFLLYLNLVSEPNEGPILFLRSKEANLRINVLKMHGCKRIPPHVASLIYSCTSMLSDTVASKRVLVVGPSNNLLSKDECHFRNLKSGSSLSVCLSLQQILGKEII